VAQTIAEKKQTKILGFRNEEMEEEKVYAPKGNCGRLQGGFQKVGRNLHFTRPHITMTTMGVPSVVAFEVEVVEPNSKYERRQALKNLDDCLEVGIQKWQNYLP
jgi:hypothetical protein